MAPLQRVLARLQPRGSSMAARPPSTFGSPDQLSADLASLRIVRDAPPPHRGRRYGGVVAAIAIIGALIAGLVWSKPYLESKVFKAEVTVTEVSLVSPAQASIDLTG